MPELDEKKRIIAYDTVNDPDENYYALIDNGTAGTGKVSIKGLGPADMISDQYSDSSTYKVGDLCIHNNKLYVCTVAINTPHAFNLSEWELDTLGNYASEIKQSLSDYIKIKTITVQKANMSTNMDLSSYVSLDSGYKFLAWQVEGTSNGWITQMPIYISTPNDVRGFPWWHPSLTISGAVNFYYFEIKDV